jgi:hypothetical protein
MPWRVSSASGMNSRYEYTYDVPRNFLVKRYLSDDARHHSVSRMAGTSDRVSDCMSISAHYSYFSYLFIIMIALNKNIFCTMISPEENIFRTLESIVNIILDGCFRTKKNIFTHTAIDITSLRNQYYKIIDRY